MQQRLQPCQRGCRIGLQRELEHLHAHRAVGLQALAGLHGTGLVDLVQADQRRDAGAFGGDQRTRQLRFAEHRFAGHQQQDLVQIGGKGLGAPVVLTEQQVAPFLDCFDHAFVAGALPAHQVADHQVGLAPAQVALHTSAFGGLDEGMPAVRGHDPRHCQPLETAQGNRASTLAAQMKSLIEMPPTEWVLKRTVQRL